MSGESLLVILLVGVIAGWLAGQIVRGTGFGLIADLVVGIMVPSLGTGCCLGSVSISVSELSRRSSTPRLARSCCCSSSGSSGAAAIGRTAVGAGGGAVGPTVVIRAREN